MDYFIVEANGRFLVLKGSSKRRDVHPIVAHFSSKEEAQAFISLHKSSKTVITISLPDEILSSVDKICSSIGCSRSFYISEILRKNL